MKCEVNKRGTFKRAFCCYSSSSGKLSLRFSLFSLSHVCINTFLLSFVLQSQSRREFPFFPLLPSLWLVNCSQMKASVCLIIPMLFLKKEFEFMKNFLPKTTMNGESWRDESFAGRKHFSFEFGELLNREFCGNLQFHERSCGRTTKHRWAAAVKLKLCIGLCKAGKQILKWNFLSVKHSRNEICTFGGQPLEN